MVVQGMPRPKMRGAGALERVIIRVVQFGLFRNKVRLSSVKFANFKVRPNSELNNPGKSC